MAKCPLIAVSIPLEAQRAHVAELSDKALTPESITAEAKASFFLFITCDNVEDTVADWTVCHPWLAKLRDAGDRVPVDVASPKIKVRRPAQGVRRRTRPSTLHYQPSLKAR